MSAQDFRAGYALLSHIGPNLVSAIVFTFCAGVAGAMIWFVFKGKR